MPGAPSSQFLVQRNSDSYILLIYYSPGGLYTGGTATTKATATDEVIITNSDNIMNGGNGVLVFGMDDAPPYGFYMVGWQPAFAGMLMRFVYDPLLTGTYGVTDTDPYIISIISGSGIGNFSFTGMGSETTSTASVDRCVGTLPSGFKGTIPALSYRAGGTLVVPGQGPQDLATSNDMSWPIPYARRTGLVSPGFKGIGTFLFWNGQNHAAIGDTLGSRSRFILGDVSLPWDGSALPM
jgi:hypothetical protein